VARGCLEAFGADEAITKTTISKKKTQKNSKTLPILIERGGGGRKPGVFSRGVVGLTLARIKEDWPNKKKNDSAR